jgi:Cys-tRNA(Pro) deacylase
LSSKNLARQLVKKTVAPCRPAVADRHSGYQVGGTSPFGLRRAMPVYFERSIGDLPLIDVNGGARGFLVELTPAELSPCSRPSSCSTGTLACTPSPLTTRPCSA